LFSCGRFPNALKQGDFLKNLIEEGVGLGLALLSEDDSEIISGAKSIARKLIHREKYEKRWTETVKGRQVRKSKSTMRLAHPIFRPDDSRAGGEWVDPTSELSVDSSGRLIGVTAENYNEVEARMVAHLDELILQSNVIATIGTEDWQWCLAYTERKHSGTPIPPADRDRFRALKTKVKKLLPTNGFS